MARPEPKPADETESAREPIEDAGADRGGPPKRRPRKRRPRRAAGGPVPDSSRRRRMRRTAIVLVSAIVLCGAFAGTAWFQHQRAERRDAAVRDSLAAATAAAQAIFSYDYHAFDASVANGKSFVTGDFAAEYAQTTSSLKSAAVAEQAVVHAQVSAIAVVSATANRVELLLYLNQYRRNADITGEKVDQNRVVLTMIPAHGGWKVVQASAI